MTKDSQLDFIGRLVECGLDEKHATIVMDLATHPPSKASEVGKRIGISRMDAYNTLKKNARYGSHKGDTGQTNGVQGLLIRLQRPGSQKVKSLNHSNSRSGKALTTKSYELH